MKIIDPGHIFEMQSFDGESPQMIDFMKRVGKNYPGNENSFPGTNCQEMLRVLISRIRYLNTQHPCDENAEMISHARAMLRLFEERAARLHKLPKPKFQYNLEELPFCPSCGHLEGVCKCA